MSPDTWRLIETTAVIALVTGIVTGLWKYFRSLSDKISRAELTEHFKERDAAHRERYAQLEARLAKWEAMSDGFAKQQSISDLNGKIENMENKIERKLDLFQQQIIALLSGRS